MLQLTFASSPPETSFFHLNSVPNDDAAVDNDGTYEGGVEMLSLALLEVGIFDGD